MQGASQDHQVRPPDDQGQVSIVLEADCFAQVLWVLTGGPDLAPLKLGRRQYCLSSQPKRFL